MFGIIKELKELPLRSAYIDNIIKKLEDYNVLQEKISQYDIAYYINSMPIISDAEYDKYKKDLKKKKTALQNLVKKNISNNKNDNSNSLAKFLVDDSSKINEILEKLLDILNQEKVGAEADSKFQKVQHRYPMLSLNNCFNESELSDFIDRIKKTLHEEFKAVCELKIDGVSFSAIYENGVLQRAVTRGDGEIGEDVTENVKQVIGVPYEIQYNDFLEVRGEIYIDRKTFDNLEEKFATPRNVASGSLRQLDSSVTKSRNLKYFIWEVDYKNNSNHYDDLKFCTELGFCVNNKYNKIVSSLDEMIDYYNIIQNERATLPYDIDGIVYKVNSKEQQKTLGSTSSAPRWAIAYKFPSEEAITTLKDIILQVSKTGILTPVAILEEINIGGVMIERATLHNAREVKEKDYRIGDKVIVTRAGDVVPRVLSVIEKIGKEKFVFPENCTVCGAKVVDDEAMVRKICTGGVNCDAQTVEKLKHFVSRGAFNIIGLGKKQIEFFFHEGFIKTYSNIFTLEGRNLKIEEIPGFGQKSVDLIFNAVRNSKNISLGKFLYSISIPNVGSETAELLANNFHKFENIINCTKNHDIAMLSQINGVGECIANSVVEFFNNEKNIFDINSLLQHIKIIAVEEKNISNNKLTGYVFLFTGGLNDYTREEAEKLSANCGAKVVDTISKKVTHVVVGEKPSIGKIEKAQELNIKIISEKEWLNLLNT